MCVCPVLYCSGLAGLLFGFAYQPNIDCLKAEVERVRTEQQERVGNLERRHNQVSSSHDQEIRNTKRMVRKVYYPVSLHL